MLVTQLGEMVCDYKKSPNNFYYLIFIVLTMQSILSFPKASPLTSHLSHAAELKWEDYSVGLLPPVWQDTWSARMSFSEEGVSSTPYPEVILVLCALHFGFSCAHIHCLLCNISSSPLGLSCSLYMGKRKNLCLRDTLSFP